MEDLGTYRCQLGMGERKIPIKRDRLHVELLGRLVVFEQRVGIARDLSRAQINDVGLRVLGRFLFHARFFLRLKVTRSSSAISAASSPCKPSESARVRS